ncbi:TetR/AcrR family transcriptional regulator [Kribbella sp. NBC_01505]|uniref:TetR/AcrR family transcriptional regulator n=1 Tax=Kribbella sp. NBC_01505 TaxID=2903580 RepID=UPI003867E133
MAMDREQVLRDAAELLMRRSGATLDEVARAAGIGRATLNRHFAGRDALVRAIEDLGVAECEAALAKAQLAEGTAAGAVRRMLAELESSAGLLAFLYSENQLFEGDQNEGWARLDAKLVALFRRGQESGEFRLELSPVWLTEAVYGLVVSAAWAIAEGRLARNDFTPMIAELLLGGAVRRSS